MATPDTRSGRIAILAGTGRLPEILANSLDKYGKPPLLIDLVGEETRWSAHHEPVTIPVTRIAAILSRLRMKGVSTLVMAGGMMGHRPRLRDFRFDFTFLRFALTAARALMKGDDGLLGTVVRSFEREGFQVLGAHEIAPELLAGEGTMTRAQPNRQDEIDMFTAIALAHDLGKKDLGQASVARNGALAALETRRGTAAMLYELAAQRGPSDRPDGVLAKISKPGQELRVDMPAIGPQTVVQAAEAGLRGIVLEAGHALMIDRAEIVRQADELGLFICGRSVDAHES